MSRPARNFRALLTVLLSLLLVVLGLPTVANADTTGEITVESYVTGHQGEVPTIAAGSSLSYTINVQCSSPDTGECTHAALVFQLPSPLHYSDTPFTISPSVATASVNGDKLTVTFNDGKLVAGQLATIAIKATLPTTASANLDGSTVNANVSASADNADTVTDSVSAKLDIPAILTAATTKTATPAATQPALPGRAVGYTITGANKSNVAVDNLTIAEPSDPTSANPFDTLALTDLTTLTPPSDADLVAFDWLDSTGTWHRGDAAAIPSTPSTLLPADPSQVRGMIFTFSKSSGQVSAGGTAAKIGLATKTRPGAFDALASGDSVSIADKATTTVTYAGRNDTDTASASVSFKKTPVAVTTNKNIIGDKLVAGDSTVVTVSATNGIMPVSTMQITEPASGSPDFAAQGVIFSGFVTSGSTDQKVSWPQGATSAQVVYHYTDSSDDTLTTTTADTLPAPADGKTVASFTVSFSGADDAIVSGAAATLAFTIAAGSVDTEAGTTASDTAQASVTNADGQSGTSSDTDTVALLPRRVRTTVSKNFSRSTLWAAAGSAMTAQLTAAVASSSTIGSDHLTITDDSVDFWDSFNLRSIVSTDIPSNSTLTVEYLDASTKSWATLTTQAGPKANWSYTPSTPDQIAGIRFVFTPATPGSLLPAGFNVAPRFQVALRPNLRSNAAVSTDPDANVDLTNEADSEVGNPIAIAPVATASASDSITLHPTGTGGGGAPDLIGKYWVTGSGPADEAHTDALAGEVSTARINWDTDGLSMSQLVITDDPRGTDGNPIANSSYDAFDLVAIKPITPSVDPLIGSDKVSKVELFLDAGWTDITSQACPSSSACDGRFPGYTLTDAQRAQARGLRITFAPGSASTTGALAISGDSTPSRGILLNMRLRNTLRSNPTAYVLGTSHSYSYNTGTVGVVSNRADALGTLTTPTAAGKTSYADTSAANMVIYDRPLNISATKTFDQSRLGLPPADTTAQSDYPLITATLSATNNTAAYVPEIAVSDPDPATTGYGSYDYLNLAQINSLAVPTGLDAGDVTVDLKHFDGNTTTTETGVSLSDAQSRTAAQLADVVGITVHYGAEANLADTSKHLIAIDGTARLQLTYQLRATVRSTGAAIDEVDKVVNTAKSAIVSPGGMGCTDGNDCDSPSATTSDWFGITQPTYAITAGKSLAPSSRYEDQPNTYSLTIAGQPSGTARTKLLTLTDATPTFWNAFDLTSIPTVTVPAPVNQLQLSVLTGVGYRYDSAGNVLSYTCGGDTDLSACWHTGSWVDAVNGKVNLALPFGINAGDVRGVQIGARSISGGTPVQWERPATPTVSITLNTTRRSYLVYGTDGNATTPVPSTRPGMATAPGEPQQGTITNTVITEGTAAWLNQGNVWTASSSATATTQLLHRVNKISVVKTPGKSSATASTPSYDLDETIPFRLKITNTGDWQMSGLTITDNVGTVETAPGSGQYSSGLVPADVSSVFTYTVNGLAVSGFSAALDTTTGKLTITVPDGFVLAPGDLLQITANLRFRDFLDVGTLVSNSVTVSSGRDFEVCDYTTDAVAQTSQTGVATCSASTQVRAAASTPMTVSKTVRGVAAGDPSAAPGSANYDDLGVINVGGSDATACATPADGYSAAPCTPITRPGGTERWRLTITNGGNVSANTVSAIDVLPAVGDTGVTVGTARKSRFSPLFAGNVQVSLPAGSSGYRIHTYYATSTSTPSCYKSDILADTSPNGASNCGLNWTEFSNADFADPTGADAALAAKVKAVKVLVSYGDAVEGIVPSGVMHVTFDTITPRQAAVADPTTVEPIAWNSAAIGSRTATVPATVDTIEYPARASLITEPRKVGVAIASGRVDLTKTVTVPDGAAWTDALPTSYSGKLVCTADGKPLSLVGTTSASDTSTVALPIAARTGTGATVHYNADGSSTLPLFAQCGFTEDDAQGAVASSTTVTASNDYSTVATIAHGWQGSAVQNLGVTNAYSFGGFTVTKKVSGPSARNAAGDAVSFKDFGFTASCTLNGTEVVPTADRSFGLRDGQAKTFANLPAGAECSVKETYNASAAKTTVSITHGGTTKAISDGDSFTLTAGPASDTALGYDNAFTIGAVTLTKTVSDASGLWGNEEFSARLLCTDDDTVDPTVYDGVLTLSKAHPNATVTDLPTGASCTVSEPRSGGANGTTITGGTFTVGNDPATPAKVGIENTFTTGSVKVTKIVQANGVVTTAEPWVSGYYPVTLSCTRTVNGTDVPVSIPDGARRILTKSNNFASTYTGLPTGATCAATEDGNGAGAVGGQPDPTVTISAPVQVDADATTAISVTNNFRAGKLAIAKTLSGVGTQFFTGATFRVDCTLDESTAFTRTGVSVTQPSLTSAVLGPIPFGASCQVAETATGGADATPAATTVTVNPSDATADVTTATLDNAFSAGTVTVSKVLTGDAKDAAWATSATFGVAVTCGLTASGPYSYNQTVSVKGGQSVQLTDSKGAPILFPYGTHCWAAEPVANGAVSALIDHDSFANAAQVVAAPGAVQNLGITATNKFTYAGFTVTKAVVTAGAVDQDSHFLTYNPTFDYTARCTFNGSTVLDDSFSLSATTSSQTGTTSWGSKSYDKLPTGASCTVTETGTGSATSTAITVKRSGETDATTSGTATTFTLVKGDAGNATGDPADNVAAITNTYQVGSVTITKVIAGPGAADWGDQEFAVELKCTSGVTTAATVYDQTFTFKRDAALSAKVDNLPTGASCTVTENKDGGATQTTYTNQTFTVGNLTTTNATVKNTFTEAGVSVRKYTRAGTPSSYRDVSTAAPWKATTYGVALTCTRTVNGANQTITRTGTITGAGTSDTWNMPTGALCSVAETGIGYPANTPTQPDATTVVDTPLLVGTKAATLNVYNYFGTGSLKVTKTIDGDGAPLWGKGRLSFAVSCTLAGSGTITTTNITAQRTQGSQTVFDSGIVPALPVGSVCTVTETNNAGAVSTKATVNSDTESADSDARQVVLKPIENGSTRAAAFVNTYRLAGFTVTKSVDVGGAVGSDGLPVKYPRSFGFSASCTYDDGINARASALNVPSFTLAAGASRQFTDLPDGANCTVKETDAQAAASTSWAVTQNGAAGATTPGTTSTFSLTRSTVDANDPGATVAAFTNSYTAGGLDITKKITGTGASTWGGGTFTLKTVCTADTDGNPGTAEVEVFNSTHALSANQTWQVRNLPTGAHCTVSEPNAAGANSTSIDTPTATITNGNQAVTVTNTFNTGSITVTKAITANGTNANSLKPWSSGTYPVTLSCTKDINGDQNAETLDLNAALGSGFDTKTITGAGTATWSGLPEGATCTVSEGTTTVAGQDQPTAVSAGSVRIDAAKTVPLTLSNEYAAGKLVIAKQITGAANTTWGTGPFGFDVSCSQTGYGTVFSATGVTLTPTAGQTSLSSAPLGPIPFGAVCTVTEQASGGATSVTSPDPLTIIANAATSNVTTASFANEFDYAGFTVAKVVDSAATNASGLPISYKAAAFTASCTFNGAEALKNSSDRSFSLAAGASKTFTGLPSGASCKVTETNTSSAASTDVRVKTSATDVTTTGATATSFDLVSGDATATVATFTNHYTTGSTTITKATAGTGAALWGGGKFTVELTCTLANAANTTVYSATHDLSAGESWPVDNLVSGASCSVNEPKTGGANTATITPSSFTVGTTTKNVSVTNTFTVGAVTVAKALTLNGASTTASPWVDGTYTVKLACTRSYNGSTVAVDIPGDSYPATDARDGVRTITGNGTTRYDDLPTGASCAASEVTSTPAAQASAVSPAVTVGDSPASPQAITVTNDFHTSTLTIAKQLEGAGQASFGDGPFSFAVSCTLPVNGKDTSVLSKTVSLKRTVASDTVLTSSAIGPVPVGSSCQVSETDAHGADFTPDPTTIVITEKAADNVAGISNQFSAGTIYLSKVLAGGAGEQAWATDATFGVRVTCEADFGSGHQQVFSTDVSLKGGQRVNVTGADGHPSRVPLGSHCWATETDAQGATASSVDKTDWGSAAVVSAGTPSTLQALELTATNTYEFAGFTVTKSVAQGGAVDAAGTPVSHSGTFGYTAACTFNGKNVLNTDFSLAHESGDSWQSRSFTNLPAGADCTVTETNTAGAPDTATVVTQNGTSAPSTSGTVAHLTLARGTGLLGKDSADVNQVAFTNGYGVGALKVTKSVTGAGADAWSDASFDIAVSCTADLDADPATQPSAVFSQTKTLTKGQSWQIDKLVAGATCTVDETAWGGATTHPAAQTVTVTRDATTPVTVTNGFALGSITVDKKFTVDGSKPAGGWTTQLSTASADVELTCTRDVNGATTAVTVPGAARRTLNSDNAFSTTYDRLPAGAECTVAEVGSTPTANATSFAPAASAVVPASDDATVDVTNDYHTGTLTIVKKVTGAGAAYGVGPFGFDVSCSLPGLDKPVYATSVALTSPTLTSSALGPIPVGATCRVSETDAAGATTPAADAEVTIPDAPGTGNAATATMVNDFSVNQITVTKVVHNGGALDADNKPIAYPGSYSFTASCSFEDATELLGTTDRAFTLTDGASHTLGGLPQGARCTVTETGSGDAVGTTTAIDGGTPVAGTSAELTVGANAGQVTFTNRYTAGAAIITKAVTGPGADAWGNAEFTLRTRCTLDTDHDGSTPAAVVFDATHPVSKASPTWELTHLASGASCTVSEPKTGGANTPAAAQKFTVGDDPESPTALTMTNRFTLGSLRVQKAISVDGKTSSAEPYASGSYQVKVSCARQIDGTDVPIDIPGDDAAAGAAADGVRTITGAGSVLYEGLPTDAACTVAEVGSSLALPAAQVSIAQPDPIGSEAAVVATVTNDYHTGTLVITKALTGDGAGAWADSSAIFAVDCSLTDANAVAHPVFSRDDVTLSRGSSLTSEPLGPIPVGAVCTVTETGTGGATVPAAPATVTITDGDPTGVTMTNRYDLGTVKVTTELTLDGTPTTATPYTGTQISVELSCRRKVNGDWEPIAVPGGAAKVITGAGSYSYSGLPIGAECSLKQTDASLHPQAVSYRPQLTGPSSVSATSDHVTVGTPDATLTAIDDFRTAPLVIKKVLTGTGADDFAVHPFTFAISCTLAEKGVDEPHLVYTNDAVTLTKSSGLTSAGLGPIPIGSTCTVTETSNGGATVVASPVTLTIAGDSDNIAQLTNQFDTGSLVVTKKITVDGSPSTAEPYRSGVYTVKLACTQQVDGQQLAVAIPGGDTRAITGAGTATFASLPRGAQCSLAESASSLAVSADHVTIDHPTFTVGEEPVNATVTNAFFTSSLVVTATFSGVGKDAFAQPLTIDVNCTLAGAAGSVFTQTVTIAPTPGQPTSSSDPLGPIPVGAVCSVTTVSANGADRVPSLVSVTSEPSTTVVAHVGASYSAGTVTVVKKLAGWGAVEHEKTPFTFAVTCRRVDTGATVADGSLTIVGAGSATLTDASGKPVLIPAGSRCWAKETNGGGAVSVSVDHAAFADGAAISSGLPDTVQRITIVVTNTFEPTDDLAYTGYALGWGLPALGLLSIGLGVFLIRRRRREQ